MLIMLFHITCSLILSSLEQYASNVDDSGLFGWCLAVFSLSGLLFAPVFGRVTDRLKSIKLSLLIGATCSVVGNVLYALVPRTECLIAGRFIAGIGNAVDGSVLGYSGQVFWVGLCEFSLYKKRNRHTATHV